MRLLFQEIKKIFRPGRCLIALAVLLILCRNLPLAQSRAMLVLHTENYPEHITIDDVYSVHQLFQDHLLEDFGSIITPEAIPELESRILHLEAQLLEASSKDPILLRVGMRYDPERGDFTPRLGSTTDEEESYLWSYINGQTQPEGMDAPIFFIYGYRNVLDILSTQSVYHPLGHDLLRLLPSNLNIPIYFTHGAGVLLLLYGVGESRSGTEALAFSTKAGRRALSRKLLAAILAGFTVALSGTLLAFFLFSRWQLQRYYGSVIDTALFLNLSQIPPDVAKLNYGTTFLYTYIVLLCVQLIGSTGYFALVTTISLHTRYHVTAIAACLPLPVLVRFYIYHCRELDRGFDPPADRYHLLVLVALVLCLRKIRYYYHRSKRKLNV